MKNPSISDPLDLALPSVLSDGAQSQALASSVVADATAEPARRAMAELVLALVAYREGAAEDGHAALARAEALAGPNPPERLAGLLEHLRAQRARRASQLAQARALLTPLHARAEARPPGDAYLTAASLGIVESMLGEDDQALDHMYQALHLARRSGVLIYMANALSNLGSYESDLSNLDDALPMLEEAVAIARQLESRWLLIFAAGNLVQCLCQQGEATRALAVAREMLIPVLRPDDPPILQRDDEIARALLDNGHVDEAAARLAGTLYEGSLTNELATARVTLLARVRLARGDPAGALALCLQRREALAADAEEVAPAADRIALLRTGAEAAAGTGDTTLAYGLLHEAFTAHEKRLGRAARARRISLQITHRLRQAEWERDGARQVASALEDLNATLRAEVAENERLRRQLERLALEDPLTGLPNRRHLFDAGARLAAMQGRRQGALALALVDLDHFKAVNDRHGHAAGDAVLRGFAALLQRQTRSGDIACRYGGEEFVLLMPDANAMQAAERLRTLLAAFAGMRFEAGGRAFDCAFSAGVADWRGGSETLEALLRRADAALYEAKAAGRAMVRCAA